MIYSKFKATYDGNHDTFRVEFLVVPTAILAFLVNHDFTPLEVGLDGSVYDSRPSQVLAFAGFADACPLPELCAQPRSVEALPPVCCSVRLVFAGRPSSTFIYFLLFSPQEVLEIKSRALCILD